MSRLINISGQRFGRLLVRRRAVAKAGSRTSWACRCDCGEETVVQGNHLTGGKIRSCGCLAREAAALRGKALLTIHGHAVRRKESPEYRSWSSMRKRCSQSSNASYTRYGGKGIKVCARWDAFEDFLADMGTKPTPKHTIDRRDSDGNYEPGNCRWATSKEQSANRRKPNRKAA